MKKANSILSQTLKNCLCLLLDEQMCEICNLSKKIHYHFFQLLIVDSLNIIISFASCMDGSSNTV